MLGKWILSVLCHYNNNQPTQILVKNDGSISEQIKLPFTLLDDANNWICNDNSTFQVAISCEWKIIGKTNNLIVHNEKLKPEKKF